MTREERKAELESIPVSEVDRLYEIHTRLYTRKHGEIKDVLIGANRARVIQAILDLEYGEE